MYLAHRTSVRKMSAKPFTFTTENDFLQWLYTYMHTRARAQVTSRKINTFHFTIILCDIIFSFLKIFEFTRAAHEDKGYYLYSNFTLAFALENLHLDANAFLVIFNIVKYPLSLSRMYIFPPAHTNSLCPFDTEIIIVLVEYERDRYISYHGMRRTMRICILYVLQVDPSRISRIPHIQDFAIGKSSDDNREFTRRESVGRTNVEEMMSFIRRKIIILPPRKWCT